jgi:hypothetical protein
MDKVEAVKMVAGIVTSVGVGAIAKEAIKNNTPAKANFVTKACIVVGGVVLTGIIVNKAADYAEERVDKIIKVGKEMYHKIIEEIRKKKEKEEIVQE